jgi:hypothetical protein
MVGFNAVESQKTSARAELVLQYNFWTAENLARTALAKGDLAGAEEQVKKMHDVLGANDNSQTHPAEHRQLMNDEKALHKAQQK